MARQSSISKSKNKCTVYELCMKMIEEKNYGIVNSKSEPENNMWNAFDTKLIEAENISLDKYIAEKFSFEAENCSTVKPAQQEKNTSNELCLKVSEAKSILLEEIETFSMEVKNCAIERRNENHKEAYINNLYQIDQVPNVDKLDIKISEVKSVSFDRNAMDMVLVKEELIVPDVKMQSIDSQNKSNVVFPGVSKLCTQIQEEKEYSASRQQNVKTKNCSVRKQRNVKRKNHSVQKQRDVKKRRCRMSKCKFCKIVFSRKYLNSHIDKCTKKYNVWEACKKVLAEKSNSQTSCGSSEIVTSDLPHLKNVLNIKLNNLTENISLIKAETSELPPLKNDFNIISNNLTEKDNLIRAETLEHPPMKNDLNIKLNNLTENDSSIQTEILELPPLKNDLNINSNNLTKTDTLIKAEILEFLPLKNDRNNKLNNLTEKDSLIKSETPELPSLKTDLIKSLIEDDFLVKAETENELCCDLSKDLEDVDIACSECGTHFTEIKKFRLHHCNILSEGYSFPFDESADEILVCNLCGMCLNEISAFQSHCHDHFPGEFDDISRKEERPLQCVKCGARFSILEELKSHCLIHINRKTYEISEENDLQSHYHTPSEGQSQIGVENPSRSIINTNDIFVCSVCKRWFMDRDKTFCHSLTHTGDSSQVVDMIQQYCFCMTCGVYFTIEDFKQHHINHTDYKSAQFKTIFMNRCVCEIGDYYGFPKMDEYDSHICTRVKIQPSAVIKERGYMKRTYICRICGLSFTKMEAYDSHFCVKTKLQQKAVKKILPKVVGKIQPKAFIKEHEDCIKVFIKEHEDCIKMPCICKHCGLGFTKREMFDSHKCIRENEPLILYELIQRKRKDKTKYLTSKDSIERIKKVAKPVISQNGTGGERKKETNPVTSQDSIEIKKKETKPVILQDSIGRKRKEETKPVVSQDLIERKRKRETRLPISQDCIGKTIKETKTVIKKQTKSKRFKIRAKSKKMPLFLI